MKLPVKPMVLHWLFRHSLSNQNKEVRQIEKQKPKNLSWRHQKKDTREEGYLELKVFIDNKKAQLSLNHLPDFKGVNKILIKWKDWQGSAKKHRRDFNLNAKLVNIEKEFHSLLMIMTAAGVEITSKKIVDTYIQLKNKRLDPTFENIQSLIRAKEVKNLKTLKQLLTDFIEYRKPDISKSTLSSHLYAEKYLSEYLKCKKIESIPAKDFDRPQFVLFIDYLRDIKKQDNTTSSIYINVIKRTFDYAVDRGVLLFNPLSSVKLEAKSKKNYLSITPEQLIILENFDFKKDNPKYEIVRDLYVFSCYTAFHTVERLNLTADNLYFDGKNYFLSGFRQKTDQIYKVKLHPKARGILYKYGKLSIGSTSAGEVEAEDMQDIYKAGLDNLPKLNNATMNEYLEIMEKIIGFKLYTSKAGRKFYATASVKAKIPQHVIGKTMGVRKETVEVYADIAGYVNDEDIDKSYNFDDAA